MKFNKIKKLEESINSINRKHDEKAISEIQNLDTATEVQTTPEKGAIEQDLKFKKRELENMEPCLEATDDLKEMTADRREQEPKEHCEGSKELKLSECLEIKKSDLDLNNLDYEDAIRKYLKEELNIEMDIIDFDENEINESFIIKNVPQTSLKEEFSENRGNEYLDMISRLANDETEAIEGYDAAVILFNTSTLPNKDKIIDKLNKIRQDELIHSQDLQLLNSMITGEPELEKAYEEDQIEDTDVVVDVNMDNEPIEDAEKVTVKEPVETVEEKEEEIEDKVEEGCQKEIKEEIEDKIFVYQFPELTDDVVEVLPDYNLELIKRDGPDGDMIVKGTKDDLEHFAANVLGGYELHPDFLCDFESFGDAWLVSSDNYGNLKAVSFEDFEKENINEDVKEEVTEQSTYTTVLNKIKDEGKEELLDNLLDDLYPAGYEEKDKEDLLTKDPSWVFIMLDIE